MARLVTSGDIALVILVLTIFEVAGLAMLHRLSGRGIGFADLLPNVLAGDFLLLAWFWNEQRIGWMPVAAALAGALVAHLVDVGRRWG